MSFVAIDAASINLDAYRVLPLGSAGAAHLWLLDLLAAHEARTDENIPTLGFVKRETAVIAALKRAALKVAGIPFEVAVYEMTTDKNGKRVPVKDSDGNRVKSYDPPQANRMGAVFTRAAREGTLPIVIERLDGDETVPAESRELVQVTVR